MFHFLVLLLAIDMQAHMASDEGQAAYSTYLSKQAAYYTAAYAPDALRAAEGSDLFGLLNTLMGNTSRIAQSSYSYNSLRNAYVGVDRDLNTAGNIIGYYDGKSMDGTWDSGTTYNREHTWPQSKGAEQGIPMGHDMQSVRPTNAAINSERGNKAYGEGSGYYDPNDVAINNTDYNPSNLGTYRGDAARVILYDYIVYGDMDGHRSNLYNGNAQLLDKLGLDGVFESLAVILKWHMQDPPSLTEMVRNDGAADYQGNRNPLIDFPELVPLIFKGQSGLTLYDVTNTSGDTLSPRYTLTTSEGFIAYVSHNGLHPDNVTVTGAQSRYDATTGRLILTNVTGAVTITTPTPLPEPEPEPQPEPEPEPVIEDGINDVTFAPIVLKKIQDGHVIIVRDNCQFDILGQPIR